MIWSVFNWTPNQKICGNAITNKHLH